MARLVVGLSVAAVAAADDLHSILAPWNIGRLTNAAAANWNLDEVSGGPFIAPSFSAKIHSSLNLGGFADSSGTFWYDRDNQRNRQQTCVNNTLFHTSGVILCTDMTNQVIDGKTQTKMNTFPADTPADEGVCRDFPSFGFTDLFSPLRTAVWNRSSSVDGVPCEVWVAHTESMGFSSELEACVTKDGAPLKLVSTTTAPHRLPMVTTNQYSDVKVGPLDESVFTYFDKVCGGKYPTKPCPGAGDVQTFKVYRVHSTTEPSTLALRDTGDALGDLAFFCNLAASYDTQVVTEWEVTANSSWGEYGFCNFLGGKNQCFGHSGKHVGRMSSMAMGSGAYAGQCTGNEDVGSWYSFPDVGECPANAEIGTGGCTWKAVRSRSVEAKCILDSGLKEECKDEVGHAPFTQSKAVFERAFSADVEHGGCADVGADASLTGKMGQNDMVLMV